MRKKITLLCIANIVLLSCFGQQADSALNMHHEAGSIYKIRPKIDIPVFVGTAALTLYNFSRISAKDASDPNYVQTLSKKDVNWFDRWGVRPYSKSDDKASYIPFYIAAPLPIAFFAVDNKMRKDFFKLSFLYAEAMTITGVLYTSAAAYTNRFRPMVYDAGTPLNKRTESDSKKSFFAGHVALVATSTFFIAKTFADYHPDSKIKWLYYSVAGAATAITAYYRHAAGEHFPSDIILGATVGTLSGILTPKLHQSKIIKNQHLSLVPFGTQGAGFTAFYKL
ncbi:MAG: phosphatase PAP2 family protein [Chitinophagaceae bacterium]